MPPKNPKKKGMNFERRARDKLRSEGYLVTRSAGSFGRFDLIAIKPASEIRSKLLMVGFTHDQIDTILSILRDCIVGVQCKTNGKLSKVEKEEMVKLARKYNLKPILARREGRKIVFEEVGADG